MPITGRERLERRGKGLYLKQAADAGGQAAFGDDFKNVQCQYRLLREDDADLQPLFYGAYLSGVLQKRGFCRRGEPGALCQLGYFGELQFYRRQDVCLRARDEHTP